jgi:hypothetical protein
MITALMTGPQGQPLTPRYEGLVFDTLEQCQYALSDENFRMLMSTTVELAYPGYVLDQIGCGAWDMSVDSDKPLELQS